ncbi:MAG TPA: DUF4388 domain-containing protein [Anaeromyxobacteraceae bacterium]|nr:DUF4388 domain-containing protein [Anaeromyxobacteraceae bacterium]
MRGLAGSFSLMPLPELVEFLSRRAVTGSLTCERGAVRKTIYLRDGCAVGAASTDPREFLGQLLINFGHIDEEQLAKAFRTQQETRIRLGKVLAMVGLVQPRVLRDVLSIKIRETLLDVFRWDSGVFRVDEDPPPPADDELGVEVPLADILKEAEFRATAWDAFLSQFPSGGATLLVDESRIPATAGEGTIDGKLLALATHGRTIDEIGLALHATEFHLYQRLYALARQGVVTPVEVVDDVEPLPGDETELQEALDESALLLARGEPGPAEAAALRALGAMPASDTARQALAAAREALSASLRGSLDRRAVPLVRLSSAEIQALGLDASQKYLLSRCDGRRALGQIAQVAPLDELEVLKAFRGFVDRGVVELRAG